MDVRALRKNAVETLWLLVDRYPNVPIARIIENAVGGLYPLSDEDFALGLNQLFVTYTQFEAAGIKP